jgi:UDP-N-acetylglucosamine/UDP-N-acetylgalactosamine diphosphorylase
MKGTTVEILVERGVRIPHPESVFVDASIRPEQVHADVTLHPGTRLAGASTSIGPGCRIGTETPATVVDCQLGAGVSLAGGYHAGSVFLDGAAFGSGAHVRPGCVLEEGASCAHAVGLKHTILLPFAVTGSLVNLCDCLLSGGTSPSDHSEVGSSYVHFNYTPHRDKATPSLLGDVPRGVLLDQPPIFLGGQGGLVGPARLAFGTIVPAGTVWRGDVTEPGQLVVAHPPARRSHRPYSAGLYGDVRRKVAHNLHYIGNLKALEQWYLFARAPWLEPTAHGRACLDGALSRIRLGIGERVGHLERLAGNMERSLALARKPGHAEDSGAARSQRWLMDHWPGLKAALNEAAEQRPSSPERDRFLAHWTSIAAPDYLSAVRSLPPDARDAAVRWLRHVVITMERPEACIPFADSPQD